MRNRASREQAIAILEELSFNATYWDSENNGPDPKITDEIWNTALLIEQLYQIMESRKQLPYFIADVPEPECSSTGDILEKIFTKEFRIKFKQPLYQLHGFLEIFHKTAYELQYGPPMQHDRSEENQTINSENKPIKLIRGSYLNIFSLTPPVSDHLHNNYIFIKSLNMLYLRLYQRTLQTSAYQDDLPNVKEDLEFGKKFRQEQTQLISRTGRTCNSAITYFDQLLKQHGKLIIVSLSLCRDVGQRGLIGKTQYQALMSEWKKFLQNGRNSHPMTWSLGFLAGIRVAQQKGLYIQAYFFFDAEQADPRDLEHAVGNYWVQTTNGCYHATPITCVKKFKYKSVYEISSKDQMGINLMHNRIIPSLTKSRLFVTPSLLLNEKQAPNSKPDQSKSETADAFLRGERPANRPKGRRKEGQSELPDDQVSS
jgi:hypothetical protein